MRMSRGQGQSKLFLWRYFLVTARWLFAVRRRCCDPRVGFVGRRFGASGASAAATRSASFDRAIPRLRSCDRSSAATTVIVPSTMRGASRSRRRMRCSSVSAADFATFQLSSTLLSEVLTCCPPGPEDREKRQPSSAAGTVSAGVISRSIHPGCQTGVNNACRDGCGPRGARTRDQRIKSPMLYQLS